MSETVATLPDLTTPERVHPLATEAYKLYAAARGVFDRRAGTALTGKIDSIAANLTELFAALSSLGAVSLYLRDNGDPVGADRLLALIRAQAYHFDEVRDRRAARIPDRAETVRAVFQKFTTVDLAPKTAPTLDARPPQGTIALKSIIPNPALRPPPKRGR
jgi:hypothetical protein